jgi:hypothetical protein
MAIPFHDRRTGQILYHGTVHPFEVGDLVTPQKGDPHAYATPSLEYATTHAKKSLDSYWRKAKSENPSYNTPFGKQYYEWEKENPPKVFQVEPVGEVEDTNNTGGDKNNVMSSEGFRVVKQIR